MVKLVGVYQGSGTKTRTKECKSRRFVPLEIESDLTLMMALDEFCLACGSDRMPHKTKQQPEDVQALLRDYDSLNKNEVSAGLKIRWEDMQSSVSQTISCVGCRRSVENHFQTLKDSSEDCSIDPLLISKDGIVSIKEDHITDPTALTNLLCHQVSRLHRQYVDAAPAKKSGVKKGGRCALHTLDLNKNNTITKVHSGPWRDCWEAMGPEVKEEVVLLPFAAIRATMDKYMEKHKFCCCCSSMMTRTFTHLIEEGKDPSKMREEEDSDGCSDYHDTDEGCAAAGSKPSRSYDDSDKKNKGPSGCGKKGFRCGERNSDDETINILAGIEPCVSDGHVHVFNNTTFISQLILLAEPDLSGLDKQEKHVKTIEKAQKEILICIGITLFNRLQKIQQKLKEGEQICDLLCLVALMSLRKSLQMKAENKNGALDLDALCFQIEQSDRDKEKKQARKREKKVKQQQKRKIQKESEQGNRDENTGDDDSGQTAHKVTSANQTSKSQGDTSGSKKTRSSPTKPKAVKGKKKSGVDTVKIGQEDSDSGLSCVDSGNSSPFYARGRFDQGNWMKGGSPDLGLGESVGKLPSWNSAPKTGFGNYYGRHDSDDSSGRSVHHSADMSSMPSLQDLLEDPEEIEIDDDEEFYISQEEMIQFKNMFPQLHQKREQLRENLRERFAALCVKCDSNTPHTH